MIPRLAIAVFLACAALSSATLAAAEGAGLKALFVAGGGYHDYHKLAPLLTAGMAKYANVTCEVKMCDKGEQLIELMKDPKLGEGYDVIVYDMCHADIFDDEMIANAKRVTKEGKPTLMVHCAMHCFWKGRKDSTWAECCGLYTNYHEAFGPFINVAVEPRSPIVKFWPENWKTEGDELYHNVKFPFPDTDSSVALLKAKDPKGVDQVVAWTHNFGKGKVFGTTLGHDTKTAATEEYQHLLANGLLWVCGKLGDDGAPAKGYAGSAAAK